MLPTLLWLCVLCSALLLATIILLILNYHRSQQQRQRFDEHQMHSLKMIQDSLLNGIERVQEHFGQRLDNTFTEVVKRLSVIDAAQQKITELSSSMVSLQEILSDKRSRGAFGEVQLMTLIKNMLPETHYRVQHTLSNGKRCDCLLLLPEPTGNIVVDAKFPLENYQQMYSTDISESIRHQAEQQFRLDIRKHIQDIAGKYILPSETAQGALMFIPAEAVFAEIHARHPDLVALSQKMNVWMVSPSTMMAVLTTARAVLKDDATRKQVHIIQEHLVLLAKDFGRFEKRMDALARHIQQAQEDVTEVHQSSKKITSRFNKIEQVELEITAES